QAYRCRRRAFAVGRAPSSGTFPSRGTSAAGAASALETTLVHHLGRPFPSGSEPASGPEVALARHVVHLDPDSLGILEQHGVVSRREPAFLRRMHDLRAQLVDGEAMDRIDVLTGPRAEAQVVQTRAALIERPPILRILVGAHEDAGTAADAVD